MLVKLYPNPATDKLSVYVVGDNTRKNLTMYDITGRVIYTQPLSDMFTTLNLQKLAKGFYFVKITGADGKVLYSEKVIKE